MNAKHLDENENGKKWTDVNTFQNAKSREDTVDTRKKLEEIAAKKLEEETFALSRETVKLIRVRY